MSGRSIVLHFGVAVVKPSGFCLLQFRDETEAGNSIPAQEIWLPKQDVEALRDFLMVEYPQEGVSHG